MKGSFRFRGTADGDMKGVKGEGSRIRYEEGSQLIGGTGLRREDLKEWIYIVGKGTCLVHHSSSLIPDIAHGPPSVDKSDL